MLLIGFCSSPGEACSSVIDLGYYSETCRTSSFISMSGIANLSTYPADKSASLPKLARMTACVDNGQVCDADQNCWYIKPRGEMSSQQKATHRLLSLEDTPVPEARLVRALLSAVVMTSHVATRRATYPSEYCHSGYCFLRGLWRADVRKRFENSLAALQINLIDIIRGNTEQSPGTAYVKIPDSYRGICRLGSSELLGGET